MTLWWAILAIGVGVASVGILYRIVKGPTILDRVVASDVLIAVVIMGLVLHAAWAHTTKTIPLIIALTMLGFVGAIAIARFVAREEPK